MLNTNLISLHLRQSEVVLLDRLPGYRHSRARADLIRGHYRRASAAANGLRFYVVRSCANGIQIGIDRVDKLVVHEEAVVRARQTLAHTSSALQNDVHMAFCNKGSTGN